MQSEGPRKGCTVVGTLVALTIAFTLLTISLNPASMSYTPSILLTNTTLLSMFSESDLIAREKYFLVFGIPSRPSNAEKRKAIRQTWTNTSGWRSLKEVEEGYKRIKVMFIFGELANGEHSPEFLEEVEQHEDMFLVAGLTEERTVLKYKVLWAMKQALNRYDFSYFIKTDDDIFVNLPVLLRSLRDSFPRERLYTGSCAHGYGGFDGYPRWNYCSGGGYVLTQDVIARIQELPRAVHAVRFRPEDAYTGWLVRGVSLGGYQVETRNEHVLKIKKYECGDWDKKWFYHNYNPRNMEDAYQMINENTTVKCGIDGRVADPVRKKRVKKNRRTRIVETSDSFIL